MHELKMVRKEVLFEATPAEVWQLLTDAKMTKQYMFGCEVLSDWELGSSVTWEMTDEKGLSIVVVQGKVTAIEQGSKVSFTMFDPNMGLEDIPRNYVTLTYDILEWEDKTQLVILQGDFATVDLGTERFEQSNKGWEQVIPLMKEVLA